MQEATMQTPNTSANANQVGGKHYYSNYQHWDWIINCGMGYLEAAITKYLYRWRNKNGIEDLRKAGHYCDKLIEMAPIVIRDRSYRVSPQYVAMETARFLEANNIQNSLEGAICRSLSDWRSPAELIATRADIEILINEAQASPTDALVEEHGSVPTGQFHDAAK